jgi:CRISPR-associated protein Csh1
MQITETRENIKRLISNRGIEELKSDQEFFYLAGQLAFYFTTKSESATKMQNMSKPFLTAKNVLQLKNVLIEQYDKYSYAIRNNDVRFKKAFNAILAYSSNAKLKQHKDIFLAGYLSENLIFGNRKENKKHDEK